MERITIEKEIEECYNATKNWNESRYNPLYYKGLHDAYTHLMRVLGKNV